MENRIPSAGIGTYMFPRNTAGGSGEPNKKRKPILHPPETRLPEKLNSLTDSDDDGESGLDEDERRPGQSPDRLLLGQQ